MSFGVRSLLLAFSVTALASAAQAAVVFIDYGDTVTSDPTITWNNHTSTTPNATLQNLLDTTGTATGIRAAASGFSGLAVVGGMSGGLTGDAAIAFGGTWTSAEQDYIYSNNTGTVTFSNLDPAGKYSFTIFGSRNNSGDRTALATATGANTASGTLNATYNTGNVIVLSDIVPNASNVITLTYGKGGLNTANPVYLNAMRIDAIVPEPASLGVLAVGALGLLRRRKA